FRDLPPGRSASRRTSRGWGPAVRGELSGDCEPQDLAGLGPAVRGELSGDCEPQDLAGLGPAVRGELSGDCEPQDLAGLGPAVRGELSGDCAGKARARSGTPNRWRPVMSYPVTPTGSWALRWRSRVSRGRRAKAGRVTPARPRAAESLRRSSACSRSAPGPRA